MIQTIEEALANGFEWNETETFPDGFRDFLVVLAHLERDKLPVPVGTGFVIRGAGRRAVVLTAAHNISHGIKRLQHPYPRHHPSTPREFLVPDEVSAASNVFRIISQNHGRVDMSRVGYLAWDDHADLAALGVLAQDDADESLFGATLLLAGANPAVGDIVATFGFAELEQHLPRRPARSV